VVCARVEVTMVMRSFLAVGMSTALFLQTGVAASAPTYCPSSSQTPCAGRQIGDILIGLHYSGRILGLNPGTGTFYTFSSALTFPVVELGDIAVVPNDPRKIVAIGNVDSGLGIKQLDSCGSVTSAVYGPFPNQLPPPLPSSIDRGGMTNRGIVFDTVSGKLYSPGFTTGLVNAPGAFDVLYTFPHDGGGVTLELANVPPPTNWVDPGQFGLVAADAHGSLYIGSGNRIAVIPAGGLQGGEPYVAEYSISHDAIDPLADIVHDGDHYLYVSSNANGQGRIWRVNTLTGVSELWADNRGPNHGYEPYNGIKGLTIDVWGDVWAVETYSGSNGRAGIAKINKNDGSLLAYFQLPSLVDGQPAAQGDPWSLAVLGVNLPATKRACASDCGQGYVADCYGACVPAYTLGDDFCDDGPHASFNCYGRAFDIDDCSACAATETPDCNGNCGPKSWVGDHICDDGSYTHNGNPIDFDCAELRFDEVTCRSCGWGEKLDCSGNCSPLSWFADGVCDDGSWDYLGHPVDYRCVEYDFDGYDCPVGG
jgi:hypothetical protein